MKGSLLPPTSSSTGWIFRTCAIGSEGGFLNKLNFGENFSLPVPASSLSTKTLLLTVWSVVSRVDREDDEECLGSTQVSLADNKIHNSDPETSSCWYNVLNFHFVMGFSNEQSQTRKTVQTSTLKTLNVPTSRQGTLKEESSDDSTIISSQTSTLTKNLAEKLDHPDQHHQRNNIDDLFEAVRNDVRKAVAQTRTSTPVMSSEPSLVDPSRTPATKLSVRKSNPNVSKASGTPNPHDVQSSMSDKETNTECIFVSPNMSQGKQPVLHGHFEGNSASSLVRRSQTFTPSALMNKNDYVCKVINFSNGLINNHHAYLSNYSTFYLAAK